MMCAVFIALSLRLLLSCVPLLLSTLLLYCCYDCCIFGCCEFAWSPVLVSPPSPLEEPQETTRKEGFDTACARLNYNENATPACTVVARFFYDFW